MTTNHDRLARVTRLERLLSNPNLLVPQLDSILAANPEAIGKDWEPDLLQQLLDDGRRLTLLDDRELECLEFDPAALLALGEEILEGWYPAWHDLFTAPPDDSNGEPTSCLVDWDPSWPDGPGDERFAFDAAGSFGEVLGEPFRKHGRAEVLSWPFQRSQATMIWVKNVPTSEGLQPDLRGLAEFQLGAFARRNANPGTWVLTLGGVLPDDDDVLLSVQLHGWNMNLFDNTRIDHIRNQEPTQVKLTGFGDPTPLFEGHESSGANLLIECCGARHHWKIHYHLNGPYLNPGFYEAWKQDPHQGNLLCLEKLEKYISLFLSKVDRTDLDPHTEAAEAIEAVIPRIFRKRFAYWEIQNFDQFSRIVFTSARNHFRNKLNKTRNQVEASTISHDGFSNSIEDKKQSSNDQARIYDLTGDRIEDIQNEISQISEKDRVLIHQKYLENKSYEEIREKFGIRSLGASRTAVSRATDRLRARLNRPDRDRDCPELT